MAAQQKPKSGDKKGSRNSNRRNGKAFGKPATTKGKPTGRTVCGYSIERVESMAKSFGLTYEMMVEQLKLRRAMRRKPSDFYLTGYKKRVSAQAGNLAGIPVQRKSSSTPGKIAKPTVISRKHDWQEGELIAETINMRCKRQGCNATWYPWQTEVMKGECSGADAKSEAAK